MCAIWLVVVGPPTSPMIIHSLFTWYLFNVMTLWVDRCSWRSIWYNNLFNVMNCQRMEYGFSIKPTSLPCCVYFHVACKSLIVNSDQVHATCAQGYSLRAWYCQCYCSYSSSWTPYGVKWRNDLIDVILGMYEAIQWIYLSYHINGPI